MSCLTWYAREPVAESVEQAAKRSVKDRIRPICYPVVLCSKVLKTCPGRAVKLCGGGRYDTSNVVYPSVINQATFPISLGGALAKR